MIGKATTLEGRTGLFFQTRDAIGIADEHFYQPDGATAYRQRGGTWTILEYGTPSSRAAFAARAEELIAKSERPEWTRRQIYGAAAPSTRFCVVRHFAPANGAKPKASKTLAFGLTKSDADKLAARTPRGIARVGKAIYHYRDIVEGE